jgi:hypothetical protein
MAAWISAEAACGQELGRRERGVSAHALAVAAEHYAFCPDNVGQGRGTLEKYAPLLVGRTTWDFWWD